MRRSTVLLLCFSALAMVGAGCGAGSGSSGNQPAKLDAVRMSVDAVGSALGALELIATQGCCAPGQLESSRKLYLTSVQGLNAALGPIAGMISGLRLPPAVHSAQQRLESTTLELVAETQRAVDTIQNARPADFPGLARKLDFTKNGVVAQLQAVLDELRAKGYDLGTLGVER
jgi:hypothetical protein